MKPALTSVSSNIGNTSCSPGCLRGPNQRPSGLDRVHFEARGFGQVHFEPSGIDRVPLWTAKERHGAAPLGLLVGPCGVDERTPRHMCAAGALRFVFRHPPGVVACPPGRTPRVFPGGQPGSLPPSPRGRRAQEEARGRAQQRGPGAEDQQRLRAEMEAERRRFEEQAARSAEDLQRELEALRCGAGGEGCTVVGSSALSPSVDRAAVLAGFCQMNLVISVPRCILLPLPHVVHAGGIEFIHFIFLRVFSSIVPRVKSSKTCRLKTNQFLFVHDIRVLDFFLVVHWN